MKVTIIFDIATTKQIMSVSTDKCPIKVGTRFKDSTGNRYTVTWVSSVVKNGVGDDMTFVTAARR